MVDSARKFPALGVRRLSVLMSLLAGISVLTTLGAPGITIDEPLDVRPGRTYCDTLARTGFKFFDKGIVTKTFADNAEHPPLGRWLLGIASIGGEFLTPWIGGADVYSVHSGRLAPALIFALLVGLVTSVSGWRFGNAGGAAAGFALMMMPRVFAHAHFAALDTFLAFFWTLGLISFVSAIESNRPLWKSGIAGVAFGLALLTKIHAWFLPPIVMLWYLIESFVFKTGKLPGWKVFLSCFCLWMVVGFATYFAGWPWLWYETFPRLSRYLGTGVDRLSLRVLYFGSNFADKDVPWHYPWFYFAVTVPLGLQVLGGLGVVRVGKENEDGAFLRLLLIAICTFLMVFSTNIPVYDGERLFLVVFPLWAMVIGTGFGWLWAHFAIKDVAVSWKQVVLCGLLLSQGHGVVSTYPFGLSYFNLAVGGLSGAESVGLEVTYWGDAVDHVLLDRLAQEIQPGETVALVPTLHHIQPSATLTQALVAKNVRLLDQSAFVTADWLVVSKREAYWPAGLRERLSGMRKVADRSRDGVWLSALFYDETRKGSSRRLGPSL